VDVIVDSSVWIDAFGGETIVEVERAIADNRIVLSPLVIAEILSGETAPRTREAVGLLLQDYPLHPTLLDHWIRVGDLRRMLRANGVNATIPDAHIAQCALDRDAVVYTRDEIFVRIAKHTSLRVTRLR
jgi:predicted nucleic acid-binding protein